jgi:hypothetical protein
LLADGEEHRGNAVAHGGGVGLLLAILDAADVAHADRVPVLFDDDERSHLLGALGAAADAQRELFGAGVDLAARRRHVLEADGALDGTRVDALRAELHRVEPDVELPLGAAEKQHLADPGDVLDLSPDLLVGDLGDLADGLVGVDRQVEHGSRVGVHLRDDRCVDVLRQVGDDAVHVVAHFLRRDVNVLVEAEGDEHLRDPLGRGGAKLVDAADRVDGFLDLVGELRLDFLGRGAGHARDDDHRGKVDLGKPIHAELEVSRGADDADDEDENGRKNGPLDADLR